MVATRWRSCCIVARPEAHIHNLGLTRAGIKPETMRDQLEHSSVLMTLDVYSHAQDRRAEAAIIERFVYPEALS